GAGVRRRARPQQARVHHPRRDLPARGVHHLPAARGLRERVGHHPGCRQLPSQGHPHRGLPGGAGPARRPHRRAARAPVPGRRRHLADAAAAALGRLSGPARRPTLPSARLLVDRPAPGEAAWQDRAVTDDADLLAAYDSCRAEVHALARAIHADPETAFEEHRAHDRCADLLEGAGFTLERGLADLPTAFRATVGTGSLVAALCVEYDALPGIGHGCGHNLIAGASLGAALALAEQVPELDLTLQVIGTPAEEHGGGKQLLIDRGVFDGVHLSLMCHPTPHTDTYDVLGSTSQAVGRWRATFTGRGAHAAANPADGINANDAAVLAQGAAGLLRQRIRDGQRRALVPQQSGVTNIIPDTAMIDLECRALTMPEFETLRRQLFACFEGAALATGTTLEIATTQPVYEPLLQDEVLGAAWNAAMRRRGRPLDGSLRVIGASTDMGNVSGAGRGARRGLERGDAAAGEAAERIARHHRRLHRHGQRVPAGALAAPLRRHHRGRRRPAHPRVRRARRLRGRIPPDGRRRGRDGERHPGRRHHGGVPRRGAGAGPTARRALSAEPRARDPADGG